MPQSEKFHQYSIEDTFKHYSTSIEGLTKEEASKRIALYGKNVMKEEKVSRIRLFLRQFNNILIYILFAASMITVAVGEWADFFVINLIIFINGFIGYWQEIKAEASIAALKKLTESRNKVMRNGELELISSADIVPGDYIILHEGEIVTADIRLSEADGLMVDEAPITGESLPVVKDHAAVLPEDAEPYEYKNSLLAGTTIVRGAGHGIVVKTGANTYLATIAEKSQEKSVETPLTKSLQFFARNYIILLVVLFVSLGIIGYFQGRTLLEMSYILLASLVSAVPEGLPIVLTLVMVIGAIALSKKQALVRYLPSVETLGSATVIASDKTGTITEGKLIVKDVFSHDLEKLKLIASLCNDSHEGSGDPLDVALYDWIPNFEEIHEKYPRKWAYSFDAKLMLMASVHEINGKKELLVKGAYESLREMVTNKEELKEIETKLDTFLQEGLRVLAFARGAWISEDPAQWKIQIVGLVGFYDPPKAGVKEAVDFAKKAGIHVIMITGDHPKTAKTIAKAVNIYRDNDSVLTGKEIATYDDERLLAALKTTTVLARILPEHKYRIVKLLQSSDEIVAVTGDGVNDVPALKAADIGIAMGGGTEAAKSVSNMVITDNNLKVIIEAIKNGRVIADNIRKVIYYLISTSLQEICIISLAIFNGLPLPLSAIQILWINIVTDGVLDKTFPFAKAEGNVMDRKPRKPEKQFFDLKQVIRLLIFGVVMGLSTFYLYIYLIQFYSYQMVSTLVFNSVVLAQWINGIQSQKESEPFLKNIRYSFTINPYIYLGLVGGIVLQAIAIYAVPDWFHSSPIPLALWKYPLMMAGIAFTVVEVRKWIEYFISLAAKKKRIA